MPTDRDRQRWLDDEQHKLSGEGSRSRRNPRVWAGLGSGFKESEGKRGKLKSRPGVPKGDVLHPVLRLDYEDVFDPDTGEKRNFHYTEWLTEHRCIACQGDVISLDDLGDPVFLSPVEPRSQGAYPNYLCPDCWAKYKLPSGKRYLARERSELWPAWLNDNYKAEQARRKQISRGVTEPEEANWLLRFLYLHSIPLKEARVLLEQRFSGEPDKLALLFYWLAGLHNADIARILGRSRARVTQLQQSLRPAVVKVLTDWLKGFVTPVAVLVWQGALLLDRLPDRPDHVLYRPDCLPIPAMHVAFTLGLPAPPPATVPVTYFFWPPDNLGLVLNAKIPTQQAEHPAVKYLVQQYRGAMLLAPHKLVAKPYPHKWRTDQLAAWQPKDEELLPPIPRLWWLRDKHPTRLKDFETPDWYARYLPAGTP